MSLERKTLSGFGDGAMAVTSRRYFSTASGIGRKAHRLSTAGRSSARGETGAGRRHHGSFGEKSAVLRHPRKRVREVSPCPVSADVAEPHLFPLTSVMASNSRSSPRRRPTADRRRCAAPFSLMLGSPANASMSRCIAPSYATKPLVCSTRNHVCDVLDVPGVLGRRGPYSPPA